MVEIDPKTGLPKELGIWESLTKETQKIKVYAKKQRYGKIVTIIDGLDNTVDKKKLAKFFKTKLACGGTVKDGRIVLQGDHKNKMKSLLVEKGFQESSIEVY